MDGGLHSNNFLIAKRCGDAARGGGRWCYTPTGIPVATGPSGTENNRRAASHHQRSSPKDAQYGTRVDALSEFMNDHSTRLSGRRSVLILGYNAGAPNPKWIHDIADTLPIDGRGNDTPTGKTSMQQNTDAGT